MKSLQHNSWVVKPLVPEEIYTDRSEFLDYFYHEALEAAHRRTMSTVLLGQRRMGKTEIFKRVVNRLFFEQDPQDPHAVVPVYYSNVLAVDISSGFIWGELNDQVTRWIRRMNEYGITKWILYLSALEEAEWIQVERIQQEIWERDRQDVSLEKIREVLVKLSRGDLIEYFPMRGQFRKIDDPILLGFLKVWGRIEVESHKRGEVEYDLVEEYSSFKRRVHEYKGYLAEVFMSQVLLSSQDRTLPGQWFHSESDIHMPWRFFFVHHRKRLRSGKGQEIDLLGAGAGEVWVCQSKWIERDKIGVNVLENLRTQAQAVREEMKPKAIRMWQFAYNGLTNETISYAQKHDILWSSLQELNELLHHIGLRQLPEL